VNTNFNLSQKLDAVQPVEARELSCGDCGGIRGVMVGRVGRPCSPPDGRPAVDPRPAPAGHRRKPPSPAAHRDPGTHRHCPTGSPLRPQAPLFFELKAGGPAEPASIPWTD
jgi:hypothetical protein